MNWVPEKHHVIDDIYLTAFKTDKFKTAVLKLSLVSPVFGDENDAAMFSLMVNLLRSGSEKYPEKADIIKRLNDLYDASCSIGGYASGDNRILEISAEMLEERFSPEESIFEGVADVMDQMLFHPRLDESGVFIEEVLAREKKVVCDKIRSEKNNSRDYAIKRCREIMCKGEPYGQRVNIEAIERITREGLFEFYKRFISEANISFSYVGAENGERIAEKLKNIFLSIPTGTKKEVAPLRSYPVKEIKETVEELNIKQGVLAMGFRTGTLLGDSDAHVMPVFNNVFGGTYMSRLFKILREKMSLCYYCSSDYVSTKAVIYVSCGINIANFEEAKSEILHQLEDLRQNLVSDEELTVAKDLAIKEMKEMGDYPGAIATFCYSRRMYDLEETVEMLSEKIKTVTAEDVLKMANKVVLDTVFFLKGIKQDENAEEEDDE